MMAAYDDPADETVEYGNSGQVSDNEAAAEFVMTLLQAGVIAHMLHLQTRSFAEHAALDGLYSAMPGKVDALVEVYQGIYGLIESYPERPELPRSDNCVAFVTGLQRFIAARRAAVSDESQVQNLIDEIAALVDATAYKLKFLS